MQAVVTFSGRAVMDFTLEHGICVRPSITLSGRSSAAGEKVAAPQASGEHFK